MGRLTKCEAQIRPPPDRTTGNHTSGTTCGTARQTLCKSSEPRFPPKPLPNRPSQQCFQCAASVKSDDGRQRQAWQVEGCPGGPRVRRQGEAPSRRGHWEGG
eukprot:s3983_g5.t1